MIVFFFRVICAHDTVQKVKLNVARDNCVSLEGDILQITWHCFGDELSQTETPVIRTSTTTAFDSMVSKQEKIMVSPPTNKRQEVICLDGTEEVMEEPKVAHKPCNNYLFMNYF